MKVQQAHKMAIIQCTKWYKCIKKIYLNYIITHNLQKYPFKVTHLIPSLKLDKYLPKIENLLSKRLI